MLKIPITAIILAGGKSTRMGLHDKGLQRLNGKPLYQHVIDKIKPQVNHIIINSNQHHDQYQRLGYPVIADQLPGFLGPLAGIYSGLITSSTDWNISVSCDTPFLPDNLVFRLYQKISQQSAAYVFDGQRIHPTLLLIHRRLANDIRQFLAQGERKLQSFLAKINAVKVDFSDTRLSFININTLEELAYWNQYLCK